MGFPAGMQLATIAFGIPLTATGKEVVTNVTVKPTARLIWAATGQPLPEFEDSFTAEAGQLGQFQVPFVDQPGFIDSMGNAVTDFAYQVTASWQFGNARPITWSKNLKPLLGQTGPIDLDLVPDGPVSIPVTAPTAAVLGFNGRTGFITLQDSDLPARLSDDQLHATYASKTVEATVASINASLQGITSGVIPAMQAGLLGRSTKVLRGVALGSSTVEGSNASPRTNRWTNRIEKMLQRSFNPAGINGGYSIRGNDPSPIWVTTGTTGNQEPFGFGFRTLKMVAGSTATHSAAVTDGFTLNFVPGATRGGVVDIQIDGGAAFRFSPKNSATGEWKSGVLTRGAHTIKITAVETTTFTDAYVHDGDHNVGLQFISAGVGGATAGNFANDANTDHWARMTRIAASVFCVPIMIGSNDYAQQVDPATFKANVIAMANKVHTALGRQVWTPLIGMPARTSTPLAIPNSAYVAKLKEIAAENSSWATFHDLSPYFPATQAADVNDLIDSDDIHPTNAGHRFEADLLAAMWGLPSRLVDTATPPAVGTGGTPPEFPGLAKDDFNRANATTLGTLTTGQTWQTGTDVWKIDNNAAQGVGHAYVNVGTANFDVSADIKFDTGSGTVGLSIHFIDANNRIAAYIDTAADALRLAKVDGGTLTNLVANAPYVDSIGTTVRLRVTSQSGVITTYLDGVQKQTYTLTSAEQTKYGAITNVGLRQNELNAHIDNFEVY